MKTASFIIQSLAGAGLQDPAAADSINQFPTTEPATLTIEKLFKQDRWFSLAGHRSHSSHGSHGSHRSGSSGVPRSSPVPSYTPPAPPRTSPSPSRNTDSVPPSSVLPSSPKLSSDPKKLRGNSDAFKQLVLKVQIALYGHGFYNGAIDGIAGPNTKAAIVSYQRSKGLPVTGVIDGALLDSLNVTLE
tara:strand:+ start:917 stop:1480 length:564 start_codon:yes stop_codon:yes gene_type:complete